MPLYDFRCHACDASFEARTAAGELARCPACGSEDTERLLSPFAGPFTVAPRGLAARRSDATRRVREEQRAERKEERRRQREEHGPPPPRKPPDASSS
ncbi:MAG TPA: zinc ribbon domain-containing protein [Solirubrobacteraceae bacterium]|nr:zinc ribbon domain-containing protein [Solirubrobacteraceae bacterium]